jgi:sortase B
MTRRQGDAYQRSKRSAGGAAGTFLITLLLVIAVGVFAYSGWRLYNYYRAYKQGTDEYSELNEEYVKPAEPAAADTQKETEASSASSGAEVLTDLTSLENPTARSEILEGANRESTVENGQTKELPKLKNPVDFAQLQNINPEVIGWIRVGSVNISYPVAQAKDNDYYLHRTFKKVDNFAGCIFENCNNSPFFTDQNTIIYGHNMKNGSMFGQLKKFKEQETFDKNPYFWMFTKDFIYQYRIFSSSIVSKIGDPYITRFSDEDFQKFIEKSISSSEIKCGDVSVTTDDRIMTLSTCTGDDATRRILQGVLVQVYISA